MKIKKIENKEKPEYDTKTEKQNKFLKLIFEHKKITITLVVLILLICVAYGIYSFYDSFQPPTPRFSAFRLFT